MKEMDKIIKKKLHDAASPYPADMWQSIHRQLPQKKKRPFVLWFMVALLLSSIGILSYLWTSKSASPLDQASHLSKNLPGSEEGNVNIYNQENTSNQKGAISQESMVSEKLAIKSKFPENLESLDATNAIYKKRVPSTKVKSGSESITIKERRVNGAKLISVNESNNLIVNDEIPSTINEVDATRLVDSKFDQRNSTRTGTLINILENKNKEFRIFGVDQSTSMEDINKSMKKHLAMQCPTFVKKQNNSFIELYFSSDYAVRKMKLHSGDNNSYIKLRNDTEKPFLSYSAGARFGIGWENGLYLKSGIDYTRINEKFTYTDPNSIQIKTITILKYIYDNNFNIIDSVKTFEEIEIPGTNTIVHQNAYVFVDLPILFQFSFPGKRRLSYSTSVGPYINLSFSQYGKILDVDAKSMVDLQTTNYYKNNIGLSFYASFAINYQLTKNIQIVFEPNVRYMPNSLTNINSTLDQKYLLASAAAGVKYKI